MRPRHVRRRVRRLRVRAGQRARSTPPPTRSAVSTWSSPTPASPPAARCWLQDLRSWERVIEINLLGVMYTDRAALPHLERSRGYLLNIASTAAVLRAPGMTAYCAAKAGVEAMSDCLRIEMQLARGRGRRRLLPVPRHRHGPRRRARDADARASQGRDAEVPGPDLPARSRRSTSWSQAIAQRRRRVSYPRWFVKALALRQLVASPLAERATGKSAPEALREYERAGCRARRRRRFGHRPHPRAGRALDVCGP